MGDAIDVDAGSGAAPAGIGAAAAENQSRGRRVAFWVVTVITALGLLAMNVFGLLEVVLMWLPGETLGSMFSEDFESVAEVEAHRAHFMGVGIIAWTVVLAVLAQLRKPQRRVAQMLLLVVVAIGATVVFGLSGTFGEWLLEEWTILIPVLLVAALHPRAGDLTRLPKFDGRMAGLIAVATVPWMVFAVNHARLQLSNAAGDPHAELEHWAVAALLALVIVGAGAIGASHHDGWRLPAWIAAIGSLAYGVHSLVFPDPASALSRMWAITAVAWGVVFAVSVIGRSRATDAVLQ